MPALLVILLVALALTWAALLNGGPFYHPDTPSYFRGAASALFKAFHLKTAWVEEYLRVYAGPAGGTGTPQSHDLDASPVTLSGRSIYYGFLLYSAYLAGSLWIAVLVQCVLTAISLFLTVRTICRSLGRPISQAALLLIGLVTAALTPASYFASNLMPEIFSGLGLMAAANLLFLWRSMTRSETLFWCAILAFAVLAHSTNLMILSAATGVALLYGWRTKTKFEVPQVISIVACLSIGVLGQALFYEAVEHTAGRPPVRPPFVAMRLIADGPGYSYLQDHCGAEQYLYCRALGRSDLSSDSLIWSSDPNVSLFRGLTPHEQRISAAQQGKFVARVIAAHPLEVVVDAARNSVVQLFSIDLLNFNCTNQNKERYESSMPPALLEPLKTTRAYHETMPVHAVEASTMLLSALSLLLFVAFLARSGTSRSMRGYVLTIIAGIAINAAICGALSGPKGRYEMRFIWILPAVAGALAYNWRNEAHAVRTTE